MVPSVAGVVLAAGAGTRLRPLSLERPKPLCPVANEPLVDLAIARLIGVVDDVAVNVCHGRELLLAHLQSTVAKTSPASRYAVHAAVEPVARGTAGALFGLRRWLDGRAALVLNGDTWCPADLSAFTSGWDGSSVRVLVLGDQPFGPRSRIIASITPWSEIPALPSTPSGLWEQVWKRHLDAGSIDVAHHGGPFVDCATPGDYLEANRQSRLRSGQADVSGSIIAGGARIGDRAEVSRSVIGDLATIDGQVTDSVVWPGAIVRRGEHLHRAIRTPTGRTVLVR